MSFHRAVDVLNRSVLQTDVCIIGSGAVGITLGLELNSRNVDVIVLEAGGLDRDRKVEGEAFAIEHLGVPYANPSPTRGRWYGGSTNLWYGRIATLCQIDFEARPWVPHSGWPLDYEELTPWIARAAEILEIPDVDRMDIGHWAGHPAVELFVERGGACLEVFVWAEGLYMGPRHRDTLAASRNVRVLLDATVSELVPTENSIAIDSVTVIGPASNRFSVQAAAYVLAAGGLENPRLLLASTGRSEHGVGNARDLVGRFYMEHPRTQASATVDLRGVDPARIAQLQVLAEHSTPEHGMAQLRVTFPRQMQRDEELLNHGVQADFASSVHGTDGYAALRRLAARARGRDVDDIGRDITSSVASDVRDALKDSPALVRHGAQRLKKRALPTSMFLHDQMEQEPDPLSRVTLDRSRRDRWGLPGLQLNWRIGDSTYRSQVRMHELLRDILHRSGIESFSSSVLDDPESPPRIMEMNHPSGTTRMSADPSRGVVDTDLRVHDMENLYIAGSSTFPTVGHANPTLTIVALAARLAEHLHRRLHP